MIRLAALAALALAADPAAAGGFSAPVAVPPPAAPVAVVPPPPAFNWSGFYLGAQAGRASAATDTLRPDGSEESYAEGEGTLLGLHAGYQRDLGRLVIGAELDYGRAGFDLPIVIPEDAGQVQFSLESLASLRLRAGFDAGRVLPYVTVGFARTGFEPIPLLADIFGDSADGRVVGVGVEFATTDRLTVGVEALRYDIDGPPFDNPSFPDDPSFETVIDTLSLRASWRF